MKFEKRGSFRRIFFALALVLLISLFFIQADVITSDNRMISSVASNPALASFDFETNMSVSAANTTGDITYINGTPMGNIQARSGKIIPLGPNINLNEIWQVKSVNETGGYGPSYMSMAPIYQVGDGLAVYTTNGNYAIFVIRSFNETNLLFDAKLQNNGSNIFGAMPVSQCSGYMNDSSCMQAAMQGTQCFWDFGMQLCRVSTSFFCPSF